MLFEVNKWYEKLKCEDVLIFHKGAISSDSITFLLNSIEQELTKRDIDPKKQKKVYNILVESLQNLYHHSSSSAERLGISQDDTVFAVTFVCERFFIYTGNYVESKKVEFLKDRIKQINHLNKEELKALYKLILNNEEFSEKGGGGLGMIDIARKSENKLIGEFYQINKNYYYFCFIVEV